MKQKRDKIFIYVTWLTKLIAGENQCEYASWFKAHFQSDRKPSNFNLVKWNIKHNQLLHERRDELEKEGYIVKVEDQNSFRLKCPKGIVVSGKADIVALGNNQRAFVDDCKTGKPSNSHLVQVMLYMMFLPKCFKKYEQTCFDGNVVYEDNVAPIYWTDIDSDLKKLVWDTIKRIGGDTPCRKVPSFDECKWCDISKEDCPERVE